MKKRFPRKQFFIWKSSQPRLLAGIEIIFVILLLISGGIFAVIANRDLTETYFKAHLTIRNTLEILIPSLVVVNFLGLIASAVVSIFFTHRIAGPIYRLCSILQKIGQGNLAQIVKFRKGDELTELGDAATEMIMGLQGRVKELKTLSAKLNAEIVNKQFDQARETAQTLDNNLSVFQMPSEDHV